VAVKPQASPTSIYKGFSQNEKCNMSANEDSHMLNTKANVRIPPNATKHQQSLGAKVPKHKCETPRET
jgi:hypothetical protein